MIDRRTLLRRAAAFVPAACEVRAIAQVRQARIGYLSSRIVPNEFEQAFERGLRERGLVPGKEVIVDYRFSAGEAERESSNIAALAAAKPDVVMLADSLVTGSARILNSLGVPVVVAAFADPVLSGLTTSLARPDGNMTGTAVFNVELSHKRLDILKQAVPGLQHAAALFNLRRRNKPLGVAASVEAGEKLGIKVTELGLVLPDGLQDGLAQAVRDGVQAVAIVSDTATIMHRAPICDATLAHKLPTMFSNRTYLRAGGLMSYGPDLEAVFQRAAYYVDRILHGAKPADLPIEQLTTFRLVLSQNTARAIGIQFPKSLLTAADEVIE
jgi:putative ABC transport system substrate-binding protein